MKTKRGRPSLLNSQQEVKVITILLNEGMSKKEMLEQYGIKDITLKRWSKKIGSLSSHGDQEILHLPYVSIEDSVELITLKMIRCGKLLSEYLDIIADRKAAKFQRTTLLLKITKCYRLILASLKEQDVANMLFLEQRLDSHLQDLSFQEGFSPCFSREAESKDRFIIVKNCSLKITAAGRSLATYVDTPKRRHCFLQELNRFKLWFNTVLSVRTEENIKNKSAAQAKDRFDS